MADHAMPPGYTGLTPFLVVQPAAAAVEFSVSTFVTGDRYGSVVDPFGQRWAIMSRVEDVSPAEAERRPAGWAAREGVSG